ncbi:hypothetical protein diail_5377 [Diaporthe ilicicola]|nr:hypothetical protein diail_5377 [Diaporthe ilicicola]
MSATATPTKRRVLGSLDANVQMSPRSPKVAASPLKRTSREASLSLSRRASPSPRKPASKEASPKKRSMEESAALQPAVKKLCSDDSAGAVPAPEANTNAVVAAAAITEKQQAVHTTDVDEPSASQPAAAARRSVSPDASSLFDVSGMNTSQDTTITEPDLDAPTTATATAPVALAATPVPSISNPLISPLPPQTRPASTREEKTEILRLRLSLANYKVKTGQVDVPLDRLQVRPVPGMTRRRTPLPSMSAHTVERSTPAQQWYRMANDRKVTATALPAHAGGSTARDGDGQPEKHILPRLSSASLSIVSTPRHKQWDAEEEERLTSSALRGGAAKGLLSLAQGPVAR